MSGNAPNDVRAAWGDSLDSAEVDRAGAVLVIDAADRVRFASEGCERLLGARADEVIGTAAAVAAGPAVVHVLDVARTDGVGRASSWQPMQLLDGLEVRVRAFAAAPDLVGLDLLPPELGATLDDSLAVERVAGWSDWLSRCSSSAELLEMVASVTRERLGFAGAWVHRLEPGGRGVVVACDAPGLADTLGHGIDVEDLPASQPRVLGRWLPFFVSDAQEQGASLLPAEGDIDLQGSYLLRPYPAFLSRMGTYGVRALACLPIVVAGQLWGHVVAHGRDREAVSAATRAELRLLAVAASARLAELIEAEDAREQIALARYSLRLIGSLASAPELVDGFLRDPADLLGMCDADGAIIAVEGRTTSSTDALTEDEIEALVVAARRLLDESPALPVASTVDTDAQADPNLAAGLLALRLGPSSEDVVVWLRGRDRRVMDWVEHQLVGDELAGQLATQAARRRTAMSEGCAPWTAAQVAQVMELRDATSQLQATRYAEVRAHNVELRRSNEEYDAFAHAAAHDLRAPLRGIAQNAEFLIEDLEGRAAPAEIEQLQTIFRLSQRMRTLLDELMTYAQIGQVALEPEDVSVRAIVDEVIELLGLAVPAEAELVVTPDTFRADAPALRQILLNLVGNAVKYGGDGPVDITIDVTTLGDARARAEPPPTLRPAADATPVLTVADRGIGMHEDHHERVFGLFRQLDPQAPGSGTGLAICRLIARRHGGDIWLASTPGEGTTFFVVTGTE